MLIVVILIVLDLLVIGRRQREVTTRDAPLWIGVYVALATMCAVGLFVFAGPATGSELVPGT